MPEITARSDIRNQCFWAGFVAVSCVATFMRRVVWFVQLAPAGWRRPGGDRGHVMFYWYHLQCMPKSNVSSGQVQRWYLTSGWVTCLEAPILSLSWWQVLGTLQLFTAGAAWLHQRLMRTRFTYSLVNKWHQTFDTFHIQWCWYLFTRMRDDNNVMQTEC